ncbi:ATP-binding protein [Noviherbaspirillum galbum]|uniref:histidine kinase n=1 Tax=Noviherbaspirillum galbum TaxID=2709383 RepID=A0A6B3SQU7_9BURK|nr:ATP-binding protein [Noviherbaspirillum galbum]NEX63137.1 PAS domain-containing protein [Noviherbaspirillum galbum]
MDHLDALKGEVAQYRFLVELDNLLRPILDPVEITLSAAQFLGQYLKVSRCAYADVEADQATLNLTGNYTNGVPSIVGRYNADTFGPEFVRLSLAGVPYVVEDAEIDERTADVRDSYRKAQIRAVVSVPIIKAGRFVAGMAVHQVVPRRWKADEISLIGMVAHRCWESIERNRIARELHESEAKFQTITNAMPQMVWTADASGLVDYHNDQLFDFAGVPRGTTSGDAWTNLVHPDDQQQAFKAWSQSVATGTPYETTYRVRHHSGEYRWTLARALPVRNGVGAIVKWMGTNTDIHSQKLAEQVLQETNARKDEFLAMLAHELRNPLAPISAASELLSISRSDDHQVQKATSIIRRQVGHMTGLIDELLDVSRVTRGLAQLENTLVDIKQVIAEAAEQVRPLMEKHGHQFSMNLSPESVFATGDHKRLVQVLSNLLDNAAKYTSPGGHITLTVSVSPGEIALSVSDDGIGMRPELLATVFDLFQQGERTADRAQGGLGIGLALVKSLIERHHGTVTANSAGPNLGSDFVIRLPRVIKASEEAPVTKPNSLTSTRRVLIVDDNIDAAHTLAMLLEVLGNQVAMDFHPEAALARSESEAFDVYLLDIGLPEIDGYELAHRLRSRQGNEKKVFVAITGYGQEQDRQQSAAAGFDYHLVKPVKADSLIELLNKLN